jgi:integrase/recombinase XerD
MSSKLLMRACTEPPRFLILQQVRVCLSALTNLTHHLMYRLAVQTGLRSEELRSFPAKYIFDPSRRDDTKASAAYRMRLNPSDMALKGGRARTIDVPTLLLADLWRYLVLKRPRRARTMRQEQPQVNEVIDALDRVNLRAAKQ